MKCPYCIKICSRCNKLLVAYNGNFHKKKTGKYGVCTECKKCKSNTNKQYREENKKKIKEQKKRYYEENKKEILEKQKEYYKEHREEKIEYEKQYKEENREKVAEYKKQYREEHKEYYQEYMKQYHKENPHISFNATSKRRERLENQGRGITKEQWHEMMNFFNWCCAYSGEYIGGEDNKNIRSIDHIIALDNEGLNEPWNCVPMFRPYNSSKFTNNMEEWYIQQEFYSEERLQKIYAWYEYAFKKWKPRRKGNRRLVI